MNASKTWALVALALCGLWASGARAEVVGEPISGSGVWAGLAGLPKVSLDAQGNTVVDFTEYWQLFGSLAGLMTEQVHLVLLPSGKGHAEVTMVLRTLHGDTLSGQGTVTLEPIVPALLLFRATGVINWGNGTGKFAGKQCVESPTVLTFNSLTYQGTCVGGS